MINVKDLLISILEEQFPDYPAFLQGSMQEDAVYPDSFFTFWNNSSEDSAFYDNTENETIFDFDLNVYSNDPDITNTALVTLKPYLKEAGFIVNGAGYDVASDEETHTGRGINLIYIDRG